MSYVLRHERCPTCELRGVDRSGDNLAVYSDGHSWCFGCGYYDAGPLSTRIEQASEEKTLVLPEFSSNDNYPSSKYDSHVTLPYFPQKVKDWLSKYGIASKEIYDNRIYYNEETQHLCFPIYYGHLIQVQQGRYFGSDPNQPRYTTSGPKSKLYKVIKGAVNPSVWVFVEDYLSAIKVARHYTAVPLLGSSFATPLILSCLGKFDILRIWLDFDKARESMKLAARARQYAPSCGTIITEKDPKEYSTMEIKEIVGSSLPRDYKSLLKP